MPNGAGNVTVAVPAGGAGAGSLETSAVPRTTETPISQPERPPSLRPSPLLARIWIEVPFSESAWPSVELGDTSPARTDQLRIPWVEDASGAVLNESEVIREASQRFREYNSMSSIEESEEITIAGILAPEFNSVVRGVSISFGPGGKDPRTQIRSGSLPSREAPFLRAAVAMRKKP